MVKAADSMPLFSKCHTRPRRPRKTDFSANAGSALATTVHIRGASVSHVIDTSSCPAPLRRAGSHQRPQWVKIFEPRRNMPPSNRTYPRMSSRHVALQAKIVRHVVATRRGKFGLRATCNDRPKGCRSDVGRHVVATCDLQRDGVPWTRIGREDKTEHWEVHRSTDVSSIPLQQPRPLQAFSLHAAVRAVPTKSRHWRNSPGGQPYC